MDVRSRVGERHTDDPFVPHAQASAREPPRDCAAVACQYLKIRRKADLPTSAKSATQRCDADVARPRSGISVVEAFDGGRNVSRCTKSSQRALGAAWRAVGGGGSSPERIKIGGRGRDARSATDGRSCGDAEALHDMERSRGGGGGTEGRAYLVGMRQSIAATRACGSSSGAGPLARSLVAELTRIVADTERLDRQPAKNSPWAGPGRHPRRHRCDRDCAHRPLRQHQIAAMGTPSAPHVYTR